MAHVYKNNLETVAAAIQDLRWVEMAELGKWLADVDIPDDADRDFWCTILNDWAQEKMSEYEKRCEEGK